MQPEVIVLDEATAMLDPLGRREVLEVARRLNQEQGVTIIAVTHFMREAVAADRLVVMADGQIALQGPPRAVFQQIEQSARPPTRRSAYQRPGHRTPSALPCLPV